MKVRVHKKDDDNVSFEVFPWRRKREDQTDEEFMDSLTINHPLHGDKFVGKEMFDIHHDELPAREDRNKWYPDFEHPTEKIKVDHNWERKIMPVDIIKQKHMDKITSFEDHKKAEKFTDKEWMQQALKNLDDKVAKGEADKPMIRAKLTAKIQQLNQEES